MCHTALCDKAEQSDISVTWGTNRIEWQICARGGTTITTETILNRNIPTITHNSMHYSVQTAGRCNTPRSISPLVTELPTQCVPTNTDFSSTLCMSCFAADITLVVQTNWYCQLYLAHQTVDLLHCSVPQKMKCFFVGDYSHWTTHTRHAKR